MQIGKINIDHAVLLAPMEDVTDISFRLVCKQLGADIVYTEFVNSEGLVRNSVKTHKKMTFLDEERPVGIQIYGGEEPSMGKAAQLAEALEPDLIDINCGCWVKNVAGRGAGAGLLRDLKKMEAVIATVVRAVRLPVTVKTRLGWDAVSIRITEVAKMVEQTGARALTIHCRTRAQGHRGDPDYSWISGVKNEVAIPIIVNGGIDSAVKAKQVFDTTGCDAVMIAQGAIHNPWIFSHIKEYLATGKIVPEPDQYQRLDVLREHLRLAVLHKGERRGVLEFRKHYAGYLRNYPGVSQIRTRLMQYTEAEPIFDYLGSLSFSQAAAPAGTTPGELARPVDA